MLYDRASDVSAFPSHRASIDITNKCTGSPGGIRADTYETLFGHLRYA
jgi:hypothetical protein